MNLSKERLDGPLRQLALLYGVQTAYYDVVSHRRRQASPEALLSVLRALGAPLENHGDAGSALRQRRQDLWQRCLEPATVSWDGAPFRVEMRLPASRAGGLARCRLQLETGEVQQWTSNLASLRVLHSAEEAGVRYVVKALRSPQKLPCGYHRFTLEWRGNIAESLIIAAPLQAYATRPQRRGRTWGVFLPLYALHSRKSWGAGDFSDLEALVEWVGQLGGGVVSTLPLLASYLDEPFDPSPYAPASRLFWNEFYLDVTRIPEVESCARVKELLGSAWLQQELNLLRSSVLVDYRRGMAVKRKVLEELARHFFAQNSHAQNSQRMANFRHYLEEHPGLEDYARFRAASDRQRAPWPSWPQPLRQGVLEPGDYDEQVRRYYLYTQWLAHEQIQAVSEKARRNGPGLYLDLPLGLHPAGYDVWRERNAFALEVSGGAPPDRVFTTGQNWAFRPLQPEKIRERGYGYFIASLRHQLQHAGLLRIDHVMALHRLYWIPDGFEDHQGVYVRYPAEELYAILSLESHRHKTSIVGENLGTVPYYVNPTMRRHQVQRMYVVQYEIAHQASRALRAVPAFSVAGLNTHDMPPFAAYWEDLDVEDRLALGLLTRKGAQSERKARHALRNALVSFLRRHGWLTSTSAETGDVLRACLAYLAASPAQIVLVNLEDLWLETQSHNVPSTGETRPNWRQKALHSLEAFRRLPEVCATLRQLRRARVGGKGF